MKTKIEIAGFEIEIVEQDGSVTIVAMKDGDTLEEIVLGQEDGTEPDMPESIEGQGVKGFDEFSQGGDEDQDEDEYQDEDEGGEMELPEEEEDFGQDEDDDDDDDDSQDEEESQDDDSKLESFQAFIKKFKK